MLAQLEAPVKIDQARVNDAQLEVTYTHITAPITGLTGLRLVDSGNMVTTSTALVVISQLQPIAVLFTIPEDALPHLFAQVRKGASPLVEAWDRTNSARLATGRFVAVDNQIDLETGTAKLKAVFDNKDGALFPNQFVNVRLFLNAQ
jgi:multidrug efflux system membrane fusion protein